MDSGNMISHNAIVRCSCDNHFLPAGSPNLVIVQGMPWHTRCALANAQAKLDHANERIRDLMKFPAKLRKLRTEIGLTPCAWCDQPLNKHFKFFGSAFYCNACWQDIGGEA